MGCDISILSRHNLNVSNVEALAIDLSERLGFSIDFGYFSHKEYDFLLHSDFDDGYVSLGYIEKKPFTKKMRLVDEQFQHKQLLQKYGEAAFGRNEMRFWYEDVQPSEETIAKELKSLKYSDYFLDNNNPESESAYLSIHDEILSNDLHYYTRWWDFCKTIQQRHYFDDEYYQSYRKAIMKDTLALGGDKAFFVNDQSNFLKGVGNSEEMYFTWRELEQHIEKCTGQTLVSISKTVLDLDYQSDIKHYKDSLVAFYDDFTDFKQNNEPDSN